jgi:hypothetical protein
MSPSEPPLPSRGRDEVSDAEARVRAHLNAMYTTLEQQLREFRRELQAQRS